MENTIPLTEINDPQRYGVDPTTMDELVYEPLMKTATYKDTQAEALDATTALLDAIKSGSPEAALAAWHAYDEADTHHWAAVVAGAYAIGLRQGLNTGTALTTAE